MPKQPAHWDLAAVTAARMRGEKTVPRFIVMRTKYRSRKLVDDWEIWVVETNGLKKPSRFDPQLRCFVRKVRCFGYGVANGPILRSAEALAAKLNYEHENGLPLSA